MCDKLPSSDVYVLEAPVSVSPTAQQSPISVTAYAQRIQLLSMLMTILTISPSHNPNYNKLHLAENIENNETFANIEPNVYFLRHSLPAR